MRISNVASTHGTVTFIAPFIGIFGTVWTIIFDTFVGLANSKLNGLVAVAEGLSQLP
jgi:biopolymer transport protein ExbB/TolQ